MMYMRASLEEMKQGSACLRYNEEKTKSPVFWLRRQSIWAHSSSYSIKQPVLCFYMCVEESWCKEADCVTPSLVAKGSVWQVAKGWREIMMTYKLMLSIVNFRNCTLFCRTNSSTFQVRLKIKNKKIPAFYSSYGTFTHLTTSNIL